MLEPWPHLTVLEEALGSCLLPGPSLATGDSLDSKSLCLTLSLYL